MFVCLSLREVKAELERVHRACQARSTLPVHLPKIDELKNEPFHDILLFRDAPVYLCIHISMQKQNGAGAAFILEPLLLYVKLHLFDLKKRKSIRLSIFRVYLILIQYMKVQKVVQYSWGCTEKHDTSYSHGRHFLS